ncbi:MAG: pyruvate kinase [Phycisphaerae bacterium]|nr:pyruvate kinase [Phycisphaerae bacterium]NUQ45186.1 pyruvate kinase [Phycisphaerae bacterium]
MTVVNHTRIIATVGPASANDETLRALIDAGTNVFRLNFSHGTPDQHADALARIRRAAADREAMVAIMGDLPGPKIRLGVVAGGPRLLAAGQTMRFVRAAQPHAADELESNYSPFIDEVQPGHRILIDDGQVVLRAGERTADALLATCEVGGVVSDRKGINLPDTPLSLPALTQRDEEYLAWSVRHGLDYVALSFVRCADDLVLLRRRITELGGDLRTVAKIEKPQAVERLAEIIDACDVLLVARGDLGVEMDVAQVPLVQKEIVRQCGYAGRPVIIATQMLQSMVTQQAPTRAEVSDVANAILDCADAVMLSAETAVGCCPAAAVRMIRRIAMETEPLMRRLAKRGNREVMAAALRVTSAVARGAALLARDLNAKLIAVWTRVGNTPSLLSKHRLEMPIVGLSPNEAVCRRMAMLYGVTPIRLEHGGSDEAMLARLDDALIRRGLARPGDLTIVITGTELTRPGSTNTLLIHLVGATTAMPHERM